MLFYFVRHGQTEANRAELLAGSGLDYPLTEEGHRQASALAALLSAHVPHPLHRLVVSNMKRARQTAGYLSEKLGLEIELHPDFREWHLGEWEGKSFSEFGHLLLGGGEPREGESRKVFYERVDRAWKNVHSDTHPYVIVAHGGVWLALQDLLKIPRFKIGNCNLVKVESSGVQWNARILA
jgi:broad specificity phosphatase PhoE